MNDPPNSTGRIGSIERDHQQLALLLPLLIHHFIQSKMQSLAPQTKHERCYVMSQLYTSQPTVNRLLTTFSSLFPSATRRTRHLLAWLLIAQLALESAPSVRCLFRQFLSKQTDASLNSYYRALGNGLVTDASIRQALALQALAIVPEALRQEPILLSVDDTSIAK